MPQIVRADASRIDDVQPLWFALRDHHASITPENWEVRSREASWEKRRQTYLDVLEEGGALFFAEDDDGKPVGLALCEREEGGSPTWAWPKDFFAIIDFIVLPDERGQGVGKALMDAVEAEARERGVAALDLMVLETNDVARRFYERYGFEAQLRTYRKRL